jgi:anti-sigma factor RsiW
MARCPSREILEQFARGRLSESESAAVEDHLETCRRCAELLARVPIGSELLERIRDLDKLRGQVASTSSWLARMEEKTTTTLFRRASSRPPA